MPSQAELKIAGLVLAAGQSKRLGRPKQLLPYGQGVLLDAVLDTARESRLDQLVLVLGGAGGDVRESVDSSGFDVVDNIEFATGCSSSIAAAIPALDPTIDILILLLGDQPGVGSGSVRALIEGIGDAEIAVCRYEDGLGHPFAFSRSMFPELEALHGDKAVWKLVEQRGLTVREVAVPGLIPFDVDTEADYEQVLRELEASR